jgi:CBS domain-containing protein
MPDDPIRLRICMESARRSGNADGHAVTLIAHQHGKNRFALVTALRGGKNPAQTITAPGQKHRQPLMPFQFPSNCSTNRWYTMKVKDIMTPNVECAWPDDTVQEAAYTMKERRRR